MTCLFYGESRGLISRRSLHPKSLRGKSYLISRKLRCLKKLRGKEKKKRKKMIWEKYVDKFYSEVDIDHLFFSFSRFFILKTQKGPRFRAGFWIISAGSWLYFFFGCAGVVDMLKYRYGKKIKILLGDLTLLIFLCFTFSLLFPCQLSIIFHTGAAGKKNIIYCIARMCRPVIRMSDLFFLFFLVRERMCKSCRSFESHLENLYLLLFHAVCGSEV